jgi:putative addiction module component (TIGR02574 family)
MPAEPNIQTLGIDRLAVSDRFRLLDEIWQSIAAEKEPIETPAWHKELLDARLAQFDLDPEAGSAWEDVEARLQSEP